MSEPTTLNEINQAGQARADAAQKKLSEGDFADERERQILIHEAAPWHIPGRSSLGALRVQFDPETQSMLIYDLGGFLTCIGTPQTLWEMCEREAEAPGYNRARLRRDALPDTALFLKLRDARTTALAAPRVRSFTEQGKEKMTLDDLGELDFGEDS